MPKRRTTAPLILRQAVQSLAIAATVALAAHVIIWLAGYSLIVMLRPGGTHQRVLRSGLRGSERLQGLSITATHQGGLGSVDILTQRASQVVGLSEPRRWSVPGSRCCGYGNNLATVGEVDCDVPLVGLNGFTHRLPRMTSTLQHCIGQRLS